MPSALGDAVAAPGRPAARLSALNVCLLAGCLGVALSSLNLPIPGGDTKPLIALAWLPLFVVLAGRVVVRLRASLPELVLLGLLVYGVLWLPIIIARGGDGDLNEYLVRMVSLTAGFSVAIVAANVPDERTLGTVVRLLLVGYGGVLAYAMLLQVPATLDLGPTRELDLQVRGLLLNRANNVKRVTMLADEPSFAAFQMSVAVLIAIVFRRHVPRRLGRFVVVAGLIGLVFAMSITAVVMFAGAFGALVLAIRSRALRLAIIIGGLVTVGAAGTVLLTAFDSYAPLARIAAIQVDASANARWLLFKSTWVGGVEADYMGLGPGQYSQRWNEFADFDASVLALLPEQLQSTLFVDNKVKPFSVFGGVFAEFGAPMLLLLVAMFGWILWRLWVLRPYPSMPAAVAVGVIILALLSAYPISLPDMWLLIGLLVAHIRLSPARPRAASFCARVPRLASAP